MIYLFAVVVLSGSFLALFALWLLVWTFTMSDETPTEAFVLEERLHAGQAYPATNPATRRRYRSA